MVRTFPILLLVLTASSCGAGTGAGGAGGTAAGPAAAEQDEKQIVPQALIGVEFKGIDTAGVTSKTLAQAAALKDKVDEEHKEHYTEEGHRAWFFHAFNKHHLYFFVARYHIECENMLGCLEYIVEEMVRVPRSEAALEKLGVKDEVDLYEVGVHGVKGGMTRDEVTAVLGEPESEMPLQLFGSFRMHYPGLDVTFYGERVLTVHETGAE